MSEILGALFAGGDAVCTGIEDTINRHFLKREEDISYAFIWQTLGATILLPFLFIVPNMLMPADLSLWAMLILSCILWTLATFLTFSSLAVIDVAEKSLLSKTRVIFSLILAVLILHESLTLHKIAGTMLVFIGAAIITISNSPTGLKLNIHKKGVVFMIAASFLVALAFIIDKFLIPHFSPIFYTFLLFAIPAIMYLPFAIGRKTQLHSVMKNAKFGVLSSVIFSSFAYFFLLNAFLATDASIVVPITELNTLVSVGTGFFFLHEKENIRKKLLAALIMIAGAVLVLI